MEYAENYHLGQTNIVNRVKRPYKLIIIKKLVRKLSIHCFIPVYNIAVLISKQDIVLQKGHEKIRVEKTISNLMWQFSESDEILYC